MDLLFLYLVTIAGVEILSKYLKGYMSRHREAWFPELSFLDPADRDGVWEDVSGKIQHLG